ncbi:MAG: J domain-containing protein, partial [Egibacteraceae bacterium]
MTEPDAYTVLGVRPEAGPAELKAAHRRLVRRHHPDLVPPAQRPAATRRVQAINVAYGLIRDPRRRAAYDRLRRVHNRDAVLAAQWDARIAEAGRWAGRWWRRNRAPLRVAAARTGSVGVDVAGRVVWLVCCA